MIPAHYPRLFLMSVREEVRIENLRRWEMLQRLGVVGLRLGEAADAFADGATKRDH